MLGTQYSHLKIVKTQPTQKRQSQGTTARLPLKSWTFFPKSAWQVGLVSKLLCFRWELSSKLLCSLTFGILSAVGSKPPGPSPNPCAPTLNASSVAPSVVRRAISEQQLVGLGPNHPPPTPPPSCPSTRKQDGIFKKQEDLQPRLRQGLPLPFPPNAGPRPQFRFQKPISQGPRTYNSYLRKLASCLAAPGTCRKYVFKSTLKTLNPEAEILHDATS